MKSYLQRIITGGILVFATTVFIVPTNNDSQIGKYQLVDNGKEHHILDTSNG